MFVLSDAGAAIPIIIDIGGYGSRRSPGRRVRSTPEPRPFRSSRVGERGDEIFVALAFEFFLGGFEGGDPHCDFFPLAREAIFPFGHAHPFLSRVPRSLVSLDWGANWETASPHCDGDVLQNLTVDKCAKLDGG
jgi:hypothetical protein